MQAFIEEVQHMMDAEAKGELQYVLNEVRLAQIQLAYDQLRTLLDDTCELHLEAYEWCKGKIAFVLESICLDILDVPKFIAVISTASTIDIVPLQSRDKVRIGIGYDGLAERYQLKPLKDRMKIIKE
jgi:hypothetical protein